ncbi:LutC/YkgG family protein [Magnetococcus sp. PR-3]|uniref:LutC/YkgG family protein n=1 Tax=Magnetococcus sp. PR-3 TaxID=3120355 RepID=UPI002FCE02F0
MSNAREAILKRLQGSAGRHPVLEPSNSIMEQSRTTPEQRTARFVAAMEAQRTEVIRTSPDDWPQVLAKLVAQEGWKQLWHGAKMPQLPALQQSGMAPHTLMPFDQPVEGLKDRLFLADAGFTTVHGAVADPGGLIVWPTPQEPRTLSLVPPVHVALLYEETIQDSLWTMMQDEGWVEEGLPTNALLISGPSKTADIEQTLVHGVHGPKRLIVLMVCSRH